MDVTPPPTLNNKTTKKAFKCVSPPPPPTIPGHASVPGVKHVFALSTIYVLIFL